MILQREREKEREEQWGPSSNQVYCNSLVYLIALDFVRSSLSMIKSLEKSYETLAEGFIISLVSFLSRNEFYRGQRHDTRFERRTWKKFSSGSCSSIRDRVCSHVCTYMCVSGDRMLSTRSSKQLERLHSEGQYRTSRVQNTLDKKHL